MGIMQSLVNYPWLASLGAGLPVGIGVLIVLWRSASSLSNWLKTAWGRLFTRSGFFWSVIFCFMAVSVWQGGAFFSISGDVVGFAVAFFLDLVTVVLMHAQLESRYRGENGRANLFIFFIVITCGMSTFANLAMALNTFKAATMLPHAPSWVQAAAPFALASSPLFVIMMSIAAEMVINVRPLDKLNARDFEEDEKKRIEILDIRNRYFMKQIDAEIELQRMRLRQRTSKVGRVWFRFPWAKTVDIDAMAASATKGLETTIEGLKAENERLSQKVDMSLPALVTQVQALQQVEPFDTEALSSRIVQQLTALYAARFEDLSQRVESLQAGNTGGDGLEEMGGSGDELVQEMQALSGDYPGLARWIESGQRSATEIDIVEVTGHTPKMISNRVKDRTFAGTNRRGAYRVSSVVRWLKVAPLPKGNRDTTSSLEAVKASSNGHSKASSNAEQLEAVTV